MVDRDPGRVAGVVLAAGSSSRLGRNKLLIDLGGETVVRRAVGQAVRAGLSPVIVVLGFEAEAVARELEGLPVETTVNERHAGGIHGSLASGIGRVPAGCDGALVMLADMPLVTAAMLAETVARFRAGCAPLVISLYGEVQAPPTLYSRQLFGALLDVGAPGGRQVVQQYRDQADVLRWPADLGADLDRPEDVAKVVLRFRGCAP
jgi:molybdenum cofactor cytidylyltransferase